MILLDLNKMDFLLHMMGGSINSCGYIQSIDYNISFLGIFVIDKVYEQEIYVIDTNKCQLLGKLSSNEMNVRLCPLDYLISNGNKVNRYMFLDMHLLIDQIIHPSNYDGDPQYKDYISLLFSKLIEEHNMECTIVKSCFAVPQSSYKEDDNPLNMIDELRDIRIIINELISRHSY